MRKILTILGGVALLALPLAGGASAEPLPPGQRPYEAGASNLGICSPYLASLGVRPDINRLLAEHPERFGVRNPGDLYSDRAQLRGAVNGPPEQECLRRS